MTLFSILVGVGSIGKESMSHRLWLIINDSFGWLGLVSFAFIKVLDRENRTDENRTTKEKLIESFQTVVQGKIESRD